MKEKNMRDHCGNALFENDNFSKSINLNSKIKVYEFLHACIENIQIEEKTFTRVNIIVINQQK